MDRRDKDTLDAFARRFSVIDEQVPAAPALEVTRPGPRSPLGGLAFAIVSVVAVVSIVAVGQRPASSTPSASMPAEPGPSRAAAVATVSPVATAPLPPGAISMDEAIGIAREQSAMPELVGAKAGTFEDLDTTPGGGGPGFPFDGAQLVWAVTFAGEITVCGGPIPVPPATPGCLAPRPATRVIFLDYLTGAFLTSQTQSPSADANRPVPSGELGTGFRGLPVDPALTPVSADDPLAAEALRRCVSPEDVSTIAGMAQLPARDVHRYTLTNGNEPELAIDELVWAIQLEGHIPMRFGTVIDPLCVVINGERTVYVPYGREGEPFSNPYNFEWPAWALPPLVRSGQ